MGSAARAAGTTSVRARTVHRERMTASAPVTRWAAFDPTPPAYRPTPPCQGAALNQGAGALLRRGGVALPILAVGRAREGSAPCRRPEYSAKSTLPSLAEYFFAV